MSFYAFTLALTIVVEAAVAVPILQLQLWRRRVGDVVLVNLVTHPLATLAVRNLEVPWIAAEIAVTAAEALIYRSLSQLGWGRAILLSVACNAVTAALSFVV